MLSAAHQLIATSSLPSAMVAAAQRLLSRGIFEVAGGELLDTELSFTPYKKEDALKVAAYKTASYSFVTPLLTGAAIAGASKAQQDLLHSYASALGVAYQLTDDLLGVFGDEQQTGKSTVSDITEGKQTYLVEMARESFSPAEHMAFIAAFGNQNATPAEIATAKQLLEASGARHKTEDKMNEYAAQARTSLDALMLPAEHHQQFLTMIDKTLYRVA